MSIDIIDLRRLLPVFQCFSARNMTLKNWEEPAPGDRPTRESTLALAAGAGAAGRIHPRVFDLGEADYRNYS